MSETVEENPSQELDNNVVVSEDNIANISIAFKETELEGYSNQYLKEKRKHVIVNGFRKGHAPEKMVAKFFGDEARKAASNAILQSKYMRALQDHRLQALSDPNLQDFKDENGVVSAKLVVDVLPPIVLGQYLGLEVETRPQPSVEAGVLNTLRAVRQQYPKLIELPDALAVEGNEVEVDFTIQLGENKEWEKQTNFRIKLGAGMFFPDFEKQVVGQKAGDSKEFDLSFPAEFPNEELKGNTAHFLLTVKKVSQMLEHTDEELAKLMNFEDVEKFKAQLASEVEAKYKEDERTYEENQILGQLLAAHQFKIPQKLVDAEARNVHAREPGLSPQDVAERAERFVRTDIILHAIYERHPEIQLSQEEFNQKFGELSAKSGDKSIQETMQKLQEKGLMQKYVNWLTGTKVVDFLLEMAEKKEMMVPVVVDQGNTVVSTEEMQKLTEEKENG